VFELYADMAKSFSIKGVTVRRITESGYCNLKHFFIPFCRLPCEEKRLRSELIKAASTAIGRSAGSAFVRAYYGQTAEQEKSFESTN